MAGTVKIQADLTVFLVVSPLAASSKWEPTLTGGVLPIQAVLLLGVEVCGAIQPVSIGARTLGITATLLVASGIKN